MIHIHIKVETGRIAVETDGDDKVVEVHASIEPERALDLANSIIKQVQAQGYPERTEDDNDL